MRRPGSRPEAADGLFTDHPGVLLGVLGADCPGVLLVHRERRALAVVHAGWRGVVAGVVEAAVACLRDRCRAAAGELWAGIGPGISASRYEVSHEVAAHVASALRGTDPRLRDQAVLPGRPGHARVDLVTAIHAQLERGGVRRARIEVHGGCTYGDPERWFSHRRDGARAGRHGLLAGWRA